MKKVWKICKYQKLFVTLQACFVGKTDKTILTYYNHEKIDLCSVHRYDH